MLDNLSLTYPKQSLWPGQEARAFPNCPHNVHTRMEPTHTVQSVTVVVVSIATATLKTVRQTILLFRSFNHYKHDQHDDIDYMDDRRKHLPLVEFASAAAAAAANWLTLAGGSGAEDDQLFRSHENL